MTVIGVRTTRFKGNDGNEVSGISLYLSAPITKYGVGQSAEKVFLSDRRAGGLLQDVGGKLENLLGAELDVYYNRYGKVESVVVKG